MAGDVRMPSVEVLLHGQSLRTDSGSVGFCSTLLIRGQKLTVVDTGHVGRRQPLLSALEAAGLEPADIDVAVMTHAHWDHAQNYDLFDNATTLIHEWELKYARNPHPNDWATPRWTSAMLDYLDNVEAVEEGYEIEPGVRIMHTPGHSPGSMGVLVETGEGTLAITGDSIHSAAVAVSRVALLVFWNEADARRSIDRVLESAEVIYPGHGRPFRMLKDGTPEFLAPQQLTLMGLDLEEPGVVVDPSPRAPWVMPGIEEQTLERLG